MTQSTVEMSINPSHVAMLNVREMLAIQFYALAVSKPVPVNEPEAKPDYEAIAKECVEKAELTTPYLFNELEKSNG